MENIKAITILEDAMDNLNNFLTEIIREKRVGSAASVGSLLVDMAEAAAKLYSATNGDTMLEPVVAAMNSNHPVEKPPVTAGAYGMSDEQLQKAMLKNFEEPEPD